MMMKSNESHENIYIKIYQIKDVGVFKTCLYIYIVTHTYIHTGMCIYIYWIMTYRSGS